MLHRYAYIFKRRRSNRTCAQEYFRRFGLGYNYHDLLRGPGIQVDGLDFAYVNTEVPVDTRATNAQKDAEVPAGPSWS